MPREPSAWLRSTFSKPAFLIAILARFFLMTLYSTPFSLNFLRRSLKSSTLTLEKEVNSKALYLENLSSTFSKISAFCFLVIGIFRFTQNQNAKIKMQNFSVALCGRFLNFTFKIKTTFGKAVGKMSRKSIKSLKSIKQNSALYKLYDFINF